jgi:hypothetical protein
MYNGSFYPEIFSGSGYVMSRTTAECLLEEGLKLPYFHLEDVFVTGFAAEKCNVQRIHHTGFHPSEMKRHKTNCANDILYHYIDTPGKLVLFNKFTSRQYRLKIICAVNFFAFLIILIIFFIFKKSEAIKIH